MKKGGFKMTAAKKALLIYFALSAAAIAVSGGEIVFLASLSHFLS